MSDITRQRHEQRMAERRRGVGDRVVTQAFGFDIPLITTTPAAIRAQRAAEAAKKAAEASTTVSTTVQTSVQEGQRRRSGRLSAGASGSLAVAQQNVASATDGSARKRRKVDSSPRESGSSTRSTPAIPNEQEEVIAKDTPEIAVTEVMMERLTVEAAPRTPITRSSSRISPRRTSLAPEASLIMSSPSPLPPRGSQPIITSSVSPEPPQFRPDPIIPEPIEEESVVEEKEGSNTPQVDATPEPTPPPKASGLRNTRRKSSKPAVAAVTPVPRGKRRRQPSPDKFITPGKPVVNEPEDEGDLSVEQIVREETAAISSPVRSTKKAQEQIAKDAAKPVPKKRGRKPKARQPSAELPMEDLPAVDDSALLSDVEPDQSGIADEMDIEEPEEQNNAEDDEEAFEDEENDEDADAGEKSSTRRATAADQTKRNTNASRKPRKPGKSKRRDENGEPKETFDITVHRIPKDGDLSFKFPKQPNNIQIISEFFLGIVDKQLGSLSSRRGEERNKEEKALLKLRESVVKGFSTALENRFIGMANKADNIKMKSAQLRRLQREKQQLRDELMQIRKSREETARQMDAVRKQHEEASEKANKQQYINDTLKNLESILEQGRAKAAAMPAEDRDDTELIGLDALITSVTEDVCSAEGDGKGVLAQIREMNRFLEASIASLQR